MREPAKLSVVTIPVEKPNLIDIAGVSVLRTPCEEVPLNLVTEHFFHELVETMYEVMYDHDGAGLAAPQVGILWRLAVLDPFGEDIGPTVVINPKIIHKSPEEERAREACLSLPGYIGKITRAKEVHIEAYDLQGEIKTYKAEGFTARLFQHEIDHLDGLVYPNRMVEGDELQEGSFHALRARRVMEQLTEKAEQE